MDNEYELMLLLKPETTEAKIKETVREALAALGKDVKVESEKNLGKRKLAYRVKKEKEAVYYLVNIKSGPLSLKEKESKLRQIDDIIRFLFVRRDN